MTEDEWNHADPGVQNEIQRLRSALRRWAGHVPEVAKLLGDTACDQCGQVLPRPELPSVGHLMHCPRFKR